MAVTTTSPQKAVPAAATPGRQKMTRVERRNFWLGLAFISPWLIGFLLWTVFPLVSSVYYSFTRYDLLRAPAFIGLSNFVEILTRDKTFRVVAVNTLYYVLIGGPLSVVAAFLLASLLNLDIKARSAYRAIFFFPAIVPAVVVAMIWSYLLNTQYGLVNGVLQGLGLPVIRFLSQPDLAKPSLILINMWASGTAMVIFLATLQDVPREYYEAATVDGANGWHKFWNITIPMCSPIILYNLVMALIWGFQDFTLPQLLTNGGPNQATLFYALYLYQNAFVYLRMGKASAMAWILFIIIVVFTIITFKLSGRWVYYGGGDD
jgi:multiple sugar transport system permease protein